MSETAARPLDRVRRLVHDRVALQPGFAIAWRRVARADPVMQQQWADATLALSDVNAGIGCIEAFWRLDPIDPAAGRAAATLCRHAGARAALACLQALPVARRCLGVGGLTVWWHAMTRLALEAPSLVQPVAGRLEKLLVADASAFMDFIAAGLKATATDKRRRIAFFTGDDPLADALLARRPGSVGFAEAERVLMPFVAGLWGGTPRLAASGILDRVTVNSGAVVFPAVFADVPATRAGALYRAAAAHAQAHLMVPPVRMPIGSLRPIQRILVGLIEDARVEALAIARFPGLRALWSPWHVATPRGGRIALSLLARLERALLDPAYVDPDGFVQKGRDLFAAADWHDATSSRAIGGLLGNDLGQMRIQLNAKTYVIEPAYRDDNGHLWDLPETEDDRVSLSVDTARANPDPEPAPRARDAGQDDRAAVLATYPEWDAAARTLRADWTTVRDAVPPRGAVSAPADALLRHQLARVVRRVAVGPRRRQPPRADGEELDLDRAIEASVARRMGQTPEVRLYRDRLPGACDRATSLILDTSQSTIARISTGETILAAQCRAAGALAEALEGGHDRFAVRSFASAGRDDVRVTRIKDFAEPLGPAVHERLAGLRPGLSTRLGAALRHAGAEVAALRVDRPLVLVMTDGEPSDIDVVDPAELVEDARRAVHDLRRGGIDVFGVIMGGMETGWPIFGRRGCLAIDRLQELPVRLGELYRRLTSD